MKPWLEKKFGNYVNNLKNFYEGDKQNQAQVAIDYIAGMTDSFTLSPP